MAAKVILKSEIGDSACSIIPFENREPRAENRDIFENKSLLAILDSLFYLKRIF
tara:strand:- start:18571 stop:18732 length:162 start_codon:yes stop_codon:yes gene_type:complete